MGKACVRGDLDTWAANGTSKGDTTVVGDCVVRDESWGVGVGIRLGQLGGPWDFW